MVMHGGKYKTLAQYFTITRLLKIYCMYGVLEKLHQQSQVRKIHGHLQIFNRIHLKKNANNLRDDERRREVEIFHTTLPQTRRFTLI